MADYTEAWKEWARDKEYVRCTCPICGQYKEGEHCSETCCTDCADRYMTILQKAMSITPDYAREQISEWLREDDGYMILQWEESPVVRSYEEVIMYLFSCCSAEEQDRIASRILGG